ncbi:hypothetical protein [Kordiimonas sp.]
MNIKIWRINAACNAAIGRTVVDAAVIRLRDQGVYRARALCGVR